MLKFQYDKQEEIPKESLGFYEEKTEGGKQVWQLKIEGVVPTTKLDEFRTNNVNLHKQVTELKARYEGIDPEEAKKLSEAVGGLKPEELAEALKQGKNVEKIVEARTKAMREESDRVISTTKAEKERIQRQLEELSINQATIAEATKLGLRPTAHLDITFRARQIFKLDPNGKPLAYDADGKTHIYGKDGSIITIREWCEQQLQAAPHLFEDSKGGGSGGDGKEKGGSGGGTEGNPFKKGSPHYSMTEQMVLMKKDPAKAKRLAAEVGVKLP